MREQGERGLTHDAGANVFVKVGADQSLRADGDGVGIFVQEEALGFGDFLEWIKILGSVFEAGVVGLAFGGDEDRGINLFPAGFGRARESS